MPEDTSTTVTPDQVYEVLRDVYDPEIALVNIVELGLIYDLAINGDHVDVTMTLTAIGCPVAGEIMQEVEDHVTSLPGVNSCHVELTFDPMWTPDKMSEDAKWELGIA